MTNGRRHRILDSLLAMILAAMLVPGLGGVALGGPPQADQLTIKAVKGEGELNAIEQVVAYDLRVEVKDQNGQPLEGVPVTLTMPETGPSATFADGTQLTVIFTGADGQAVAKGIRANSVLGDFQIRVSASREGKTGSVLISQRNVTEEAKIAAAEAPKPIAGPAAPSPPKEKSKTGLIVAIVGAAAAGGLAAALGGGGGGARVNVGGGGGTCPPGTTGVPPNCQSIPPSSPSISISSGGAPTFGAPR